MHLEINWLKTGLHQARNLAAASARDPEQANRNRDGRLLQTQLPPALLKSTARTTMSIPLREGIVIGRPHWMASIAWLSFSVVGRSRSTGGSEDDSADIPPGRNGREQCHNLGHCSVGSERLSHGHLVGLLALIGSRRLPAGGSDCFPVAKTRLWPTILSGIRSGSVNQSLNLSITAIAGQVDLELSFAVGSGFHSAEVRTAEICRSTLVLLKEQRHQLDVQELRQLQLIEGWYRYAPRRSPGLGRQSAPPDPLPRCSWGSSIPFDASWIHVRGSVVAGFRRRRDSTLVSLRILLLLVLVPLLIQQVSGTYLIAPALERFSPQLSFLSESRPQLEERSVEQLRIYKEELEFEALLKGEEPPSSTELVQKLRQRAAQLQQDADQESVRALHNVLSEFAGLVAFVVLCLVSRKQLRVLRDFWMKPFMASAIQPKPLPSFCSRSWLSQPRRLDCSFARHCPSPDYRPRRTSSCCSSLHSVILATIFKY